MGIGRETSTLAGTAASMEEIERMVEELRERVAHGLSTAANGEAEAQPHPPPSPGPDAEVGADSIEGDHVDAAEKDHDDIGALRDGLVSMRALVAHSEEASGTFAAVAREFLDGCSELVTRLELAMHLGSEQAAVRPALAEPKPATPPEPAAVPEAPADPAHEEGRLFTGTVRLEVGPFGDIATVSTFVQALTGVDGVSDVYVRGFEADRAQIDVSLDGEMPFAERLLAELGDETRLGEMDDSRLVLDLATREDLGR